MQGPGNHSIQGEVRGEPFLLVLSFHFPGDSISGVCCCYLCSHGLWAAWDSFVSASHPALGMLGLQRPLPHAPLNGIPTQVLTLYISFLPTKLSLQPFLAHSRWFWLVTVHLEHGRGFVLEFCLLALVIWFWDVPTCLSFFSKPLPELILRKWRTSPLYEFDWSWSTLKRIYSLYQETLFIR